MRSWGTLTERRVETSLSLSLFPFLSVLQLCFDVFFSAPNYYIEIFFYLNDSLFLIRSSCSSLVYLCFAIFGFFLSVYQIDILVTGTSGYYQHRLWHSKSNYSKSLTSMHTKYEKNVWNSTTTTMKKEETNRVNKKIK